MQEGAHPHPCGYLQPFGHTSIIHVARLEGQATVDLLPMTLIRRSHCACD